MTKQEKLKSLEAAMTTSKREGEEDSFYHFSDSAPEELKNLFLEHYEVRDIDYETFSRACDIVSEVYAEYSGDDTGKDEQEASEDDKITDAIYERSSDSANPYTAVRLAYLNVWNQDEVADYVRDLHVDVATGAAYWYDKQVEQQAIIIKDWINV